MRILTVGNFTRGWDQSICDEEHIANSLENFGHKVVRQQRNDFVQLSPTPKSDFDFILVAQWDGYRDGLDRLKEFECPIVYWAFDHQADGQPWHEHLIRESDLYLSKLLSDSKYPNWQWLSQDFAPSFLNADWENRPEKDIQVLFTGSYLPWATERTDILKAVDKQFDLQVYSFTPDQWKDQGLKNVRGPVMDEELNGLIPRAHINLSIDHTYAPGYWSDRNAQAMACGGVVLFKYVPLSEAIFKDAVQYFYNKEDCLQRIDWLLVQDTTSLEGYAWSFAQNNLMVQNRVQQLLTIVGSKL